MIIVVSVLVVVESETSSSLASSTPWQPATAASCCTSASAVTHREVVAMDKSRSGSPGFSRKERADPQGQMARTRQHRHADAVLRTRHLSCVLQPSALDRRTCQLAWPRTPARSACTRWTDPVSRSCRPAAQRWLGSKNGLCLTPIG